MATENTLQLLMIDSNNNNAILSNWLFYRWYIATGGTETYSEAQINAQTQGVNLRDYLLYKMQ